MIKIKDLELKLGKREIFSGFNLEIARGEKVGIIGGEGAGLVCPQGKGGSVQLDEDDSGFRGRLEGEWSGYPDARTCSYP